MSLVHVEQGNLSFGERDVFADISFRIEAGDRLGLIGANGTGKTTLLKILAQNASFDSGHLHYQEGARIGYLDQNLSLVDDRTVLEFVLASLPDKTQLEKQHATLQEQMTDTSLSDDQLIELAESFSEIEERLNWYESEYSEFSAKRILGGLGFSPTDLERSLNEFSGGWRVRAYLGALLFQKPDLLLLDEPTNHLDMPSVGWFSDFLKKYRQAFVLISHDREFLNEQIRKVIALEPQGLRTYTGNLDAYEKARGEEEVILEKRAENVARERARLERFVERFRAKASKASAAQSKLKQLEKLESVEKLEQQKYLQFSFPPVKRCGSPVLRVTGIRKSFDKLEVLKGIDAAVLQGEKVALIGPNGAGKTTLLRIIAKELEANQGNVSLGHHVEMAYYAQHHADSLTLNNTIYQELQNAHPDLTQTQLRRILGTVLFSGDDVDKPIHVLSGGERARVALAKLLASPGNFLLMDEPTNHLDLGSTQGLIKALKDFGGSLLFVSHNRTLVRQVATQIWNVQDGHIEVYPGTLDEYLYHHRDDTGDDNTKSSSEKSEPKLSKKEKRRLAAQQRQKKAKTLAPLTEAVSKLEGRIAKLELKQQSIGEALKDPSQYEDPQRRGELLAEFQKHEQKLKELNSRWEHAAEELEAAESRLGNEDS